MKIVRFMMNGKKHYGQVKENIVYTIAGNIFGNFQLSDEKYRLEEIRLLSPVQPTKIIGLGLNYKSVAIKKGLKYPAEPIFFLKPPSTLLGCDDTIILPNVVKKPVYEIELGVVIGKRAKNVNEREALDYVFGYTLCNDITAVDQINEGQPWARAKSFDTFTPIGPWIVQ